MVEITRNKEIVFSSAQAAADPCSLHICISPLAMSGETSITARRTGYKNKIEPGSTRYSSGRDLLSVTLAYHCRLSALAAAPLTRAPRCHLDCHPCVAIRRLSRLSLIRMCTHRWNYTVTPDYFSSIGPCWSFCHGSSPHTPRGVQRPAHGGIAPRTCALHTRFSGYGAS